MAVEVGVYTLF